MSDHSIVYWYSGLEKHMCGYCKNSKGNISHGMWAKILTVEDYQNLIDRGWRRSGNYCYKPLMDQICCPMYTIKCDALYFRMSKSQKKVTKKFNKFLKDGELSKGSNQQHHEDSSDNVSEFVYREAPTHLIDQEQMIEADAVIVSDTVDGNIASGSNLRPILPEPNSSKSQQNGQESQMSDQTKHQPKSGIGADPSKPPCKKAKLLRLERKKEKLLKKGMIVETLEVKNEQKSVEDFLNEIPENGKHKFKLELIHTGSRSKEWEKLKKIEFALYKKYQMTVHNDPPEKCNMDGFLRFLVNSPLQVFFQRSGFKSRITLEQIHEKHKYFQLTADLFKKYQVAIHNESPDDCDVFQYLNFLVDTPLQHVKFTKNSELGFGSFHQLYWLDDKLIAVGVIDILPKCVSAVYFFYDPDYRDLTLGTYGSLREVQFARSLHQKIPSIVNYYMGFYIHSCPKMRYKGKLAPSYLLCPETYHWVAIEKCLAKLEVSKYSRLEENEAATDENACSASDIDGMKILINRRLVLLRQYKIQYDVEDLFNTIAQLVGQKCSKSLIFIGED